jgi:hypothetical protein
VFEGVERGVKNRIIDRKLFWEGDSSDGDGVLFGLKSLGAILEGIQMTDGEGRDKDMSP